jgi:hypothetical protein
LYEVILVRLKERIARRHEADAAPTEIPAA